MPLFMDIHYPHRRHDRGRRGASARGGCKDTAEVRREISALLVRRQRRARCSVWSRRRTRKRRSPSIVRPTASSPTITRGLGRRVAHGALRHCTTRNIDNECDTNRLQTPRPQTSRPSRRASSATWASGDFGIIGTTLQIVGESLCEAVDLRAGSKVLDVAAGNGNCSLAAARRWCDVTSTDYVPALLEDGRRRAAAERLPISFQRRRRRGAAVRGRRVRRGAVVVRRDVRARTTTRAAARCCACAAPAAASAWPTGRRPDSSAGCSRVVGRHVPPPPGVTPPSRGACRSTSAAVRRRRRADIRTTPRDFAFRYRSAEHWVDVFRTWYGPVHKAFASLPAEAQAGSSRTSRV